MITTEEHKKKKKANKVLFRNLKKDAKTKKRLLDRLVGKNHNIENDEE